MLAWVTVGILLTLSGIFEGSDVATFLGAAMAFGFVSACLTSVVKGEGRLKRVAEVASAALALGTVVAGYVVTGDAILGIATFFIVVMLFFGLVASWLLPRFFEKAAKSARSSANRF